MADALPAWPGCTLVCNRPNSKLPVPKSFVSIFKEHKKYNAPSSGSDSISLTVFTKTYRKISLVFSDPPSFFIHRPPLIRRILCAPQAELCAVASPADQVPHAMAALKRLHTNTSSSANSNNDSNNAEGHEGNNGSGSGNSDEVDEAGESDFVRLCVELLADVRDPLDNSNEDAETRAQRVKAETRAEELHALIAQVTVIVIVIVIVVVVVVVGGCW
jgi:hypothetical protein